MPYDVQDVVIPNTVRKIEECAFLDRTDLETIMISDGVTSIGDAAFRECESLESIAIPNSVTSIGDDAFLGCSSLKSITIPNSVTSIGDRAFLGCSSLRSIIISDSMTSISADTFHGCESLESIIIPNNVTDIKGMAFCGCSSLQSIAIPDSVTNIGYAAFRGCSSLRTITIPDSVTSIGGSAFCECSSLRSITIPGNVPGIRDRTFKRCSSLQSITMPNSVTSIGIEAFWECESLKSITIPNNVTNIGESAFWKCSSLRSIAIPASVTSIGKMAFSECSSLQSVVIPVSVTSIGYGAFTECHSLRSITIPNKITCIELSTFHHCSSLQSVTLSDNVTEFKGDPFAYCHNIESMIFKGVNIAPFINVDGYGENTFRVIKTLTDHGISLNEYIVKRGIEMAHQRKLRGWAKRYPTFGEMRLPSGTNTVNEKDIELLRQYFISQTRTKSHVPKILEELAITSQVCRIQPERLVNTFDVDYTKDLIANKIPFVPAEACRCYYDRSICDALIQKGKVSIMAEAISLYNTSQQKTCYKYLMDFIVSHMDTNTEDLIYAVDHAEELPMRADTTMAQLRHHQTYMENLEEVDRIEAEYEEYIPGFRLSNYSCSIDQTSIAYNGMTARVLGLSNTEDIALAARLGELTSCCQRLGRAGETAMMHGFMNPDAGFWVIEDKDRSVKAQAEIWESDKGTLVFDNIEFANTDSDSTEERIEQLRNVIAAWAMDARYKDIIMGCGYNELGANSMEKAPVPKLSLTPEEVFAFQKDNDAGVTFESINDAKDYMQSHKYKPDDFIYTDTNKQCVYIKKDGEVSNYLMRGYDRSLVANHIANKKVVSEQEISDGICK